MCTHTWKVMLARQNGKRVDARRADHDPVRITDSLPSPWSPLRSCIWLSGEVGGILIGAPARCRLGGEHRALAGAAYPISRRTEPEQLRGPG